MIEDTINDIVQFCKILGGRADVHITEKGNAIIECEGIEKHRISKITLEGDKILIDIYKEFEDEELKALSPLFGPPPPETKEIRAYGNVIIYRRIKNDDYVSEIVLGKKIDKIRGDMDIIRLNAVISPSRPKSTYIEFL